MNNCIRCCEEIEAMEPRGYCNECLALFMEQKRSIARKQSTRGVCVDGKFADESPKSFIDDGVARCGMCGSPELMAGYGFCGFGLGRHNYCLICNTFLDFQEDT